MAIKLTDRMHKVEGVAYRPGSYGARGIFAVEMTYKGLGFTKEEALEWTSYGIAPEVALSLKSKGLSVMAIKMAGPTYEGYLRDVARGNIVAQMYLSEFANDLRNESLAVMPDRDTFGFDEDGDEDMVQYKGEKKTAKKSSTRKSKSSSVSEVSVSGSSMSEMDSKPPSKRFLLASKNGSSSRK